MNNNPFYNQFYKYYQELWKNTENPKPAFQEMVAEINENSRAKLKAQLIDELAKHHYNNEEERIPSPKADQIELKKRKLIDKYNKIHKN